MKKNIEDIYVEYFDLVYKYLYCLTQNGDLAEELTQDTFFKAIMNINTFKNQSKISTWLCQIAKNLYFDELRKKKKISDTSDDIFDYINIDESIENKFISNEEHSELNKKIDSLDDMTKKVIYLHIYDDLTFKEIGKMLR